jgi:hypothetical protein
MKISTAKLKRLIREELFYREFYRRDDALNEEDADDWRDRQIEDAVADGQAAGAGGEPPVTGYKSFQRDYDNAYVNAAAEKGYQLMAANDAVPHPSAMKSHTQNPAEGGGWPCAVCEDYADRVVGDAVEFDDPMFTAIVRKLVKRAGGNPEAY